MSVLVKGMEMPTDCGKCFVGDRTMCRDKCPLDTVIHCKDCKYCEHTLKRPNVWKPNETSDEQYNCMREENGTKPIVFPDSFCSFGKYGDMRVTL